MFFGKNTRKVECVYSNDVSQVFLTCVISVILTDEHNKKTVQVSSIKGTHIHLIGFITVYLTDFCALVYVSAKSSKTIDECNAVIQSINSNITNDT